MIWTKLTKEQFNIEFDRLWNNTQSNLFKLEVLPDYSEDHNELYDLYRQGKLLQLHDEWVKLLSGERINFKWKRVHLVDLPLTEYLKFEIECYKVWEELGVEVFFQTFDAIKDVYNKPIFEDFLIFDSKTVIVNEFDGYDYVGSRITEDVQTVKKYVDFQKVLEKNTVTMKKFINAFYS